jgi:hypothetical protein
MNKANMAGLTIVLAIAVTVGTAQVTTRTDKPEGGAPAVAGGAPGQVVTVQEYQTRLREAYVSVGLPGTVIEQVLPVDVEIYNARLAKDMEKVRVLRQRQVELVTPAYLPKVRTYFGSHPYVVNIGGGPFTVWVEDSDGDIVPVTVYEQRLRTAYVAIGLPETIIVQLIPMDLQIYNAYAIGNVTLVVQLQERQYRLIPPDHVTKVTTYFRENPIRVKAKPDVTFVPWQKPSESATAATGAPVATTEAKTEPVKADQAKTVPAQPEAGKLAKDATPTPSIQGTAPAATPPADTAKDAAPTPSTKGAIPATPRAGDQKLIERKPQVPAPGAMAPKSGERDTLSRDKQQQPSPMTEKAPDSGTMTKPEGKPEAKAPEMKEQ